MNERGRAVDYARWVIRRRIPILLLSVIAVIAAGLGARNLGFSNDYRDFFSDENPELEAFEALQDIYTKNDNILIVVAPESGDVFTHETLSAVERLVEGAWQVPYAIRVDGLTNYQHTEATEDDLLVEDLVPDAAAASPAALRKARRVALSEPLLVNRIVSDRGHVTGVNITLQLPGEDQAEAVESVEAVRALVAEVEEAYPDVETYLTGNVMLSNAFFENSVKDMSTLVPIMYLAIVLAMIALLRSVSGTVSTVVVIGASVVTAMGLAGWAGVLLTPPSSVAPTMIMTLAVADSVHILVTMLREMQQGRGKNEALVESLRVNLQPVFLTSLTTAIGFLSMNFSDSPPFRDLGNITAAGVLAAFAFSILTLPALMSVLPVRAPVRRDRRTGAMERLGDWVVARRTPLLWGSAAVVVGLAFLVPRNELNDHFVNYFDETVEFRRDTDFTTENLTGIYIVDFSVGAGESGGISEPEYLARLDDFVAWYRDQPGVVQVNSLAHVIKRLNRNMHGDDPAAYRIPASRELAAQYLLLYEMSLPYGLDLNDQINVDKSATKVAVTMSGDLTTREVRALADAGADWLDENAPPFMAATGSGPVVMFSHISDRNIRGMLKGTLLAFFLISAILALALRDARLGLLSLIPNIVPAVMAFGVWALIVGQVNIALSTVVAMTIGIVVDDTVHFLSKYRRARREKGLEAPDAVRYAFSTVGTALVVTSIILAVGFGILAQSAFDLNAGMGKLTAVTILLALAADFLFLPPMLIRLDGWLSGASDSPGDTPTERRTDPMTTHSNTRRKLGAGVATVLLALGMGTVPLAGQNADEGDAIPSPSATTILSGSATPEERGMEIALEVERRDTGFGDYTASLQMVLRNRHGEESTRQMRTRTLEVEGDGDKSLVIFDQPRDVQGTALLSFTHKQGSDDQWLYLPALRRVKRIASNNKSGPFMGSEFAYEDISSQEVEKYTYRFVGEEALDGRPTLVVERYPVDESSGYTRQVVWYDAERFIPLKLDYYDRKDDHLKTLTFHDYREYLGRYWRADRYEMVNHQTGKSTTLLWEGYEFRTGLNERDFDQNALKRAR